MSPSQLPNTPLNPTVESVPGAVDRPAEKKSVQRSTNKKRSLNPQSLVKGNKTERDFSEVCDFELLATLQDSLVLPSGISCCHRSPLPSKKDEAGGEEDLITMTHKVRKDFSDRNEITENHFGTSSGLMQCRSTRCPVCSKAIASNERFKILRAVKKTPESMSYFFITLTVQHSNSGVEKLSIEERAKHFEKFSLKNMTDAIDNSFKRVRELVAWKKKAFGEKPFWWHSTKEETYSLDNGFHPHQHILVAVDFSTQLTKIMSSEELKGLQGLELKNKISELEVNHIQEVLGQEYLKKLQKNGYTCGDKVGLVVERISSTDIQNIANYVSKGLCCDKLTNEFAPSQRSKSSRSSRSFPTYQIMNHYTGNLINEDLLEFQEKLGVDGSHYFKRVITEYYTDLKNVRTYSSCSKFKELSKQSDKDKEIESKELEEKKARTIDVAHVEFPKLVKKYLNRRRLNSYFSWFYKNPDAKKYYQQLSECLPPPLFERCRLIEINKENQYINSYNTQAIESAAPQAAVPFTCALQAVFSHELNQ